jgi:hypothetical protein
MCFKDNNKIRPMVGEREKVEGERVKVLRRREVEKDSV